MLRDALGKRRTTDVAGGDEQDLEPPPSCHHFQVRGDGAQVVGGHRTHPQQTRWSPVRSTMEDGTASVVARPRGRPRPLPQLLQGLRGCCRRRRPDRLAAAHRERTGGTQQLPAPPRATASAPATVPRASPRSHINEAAGAGSRSTHRPERGYQVAADVRICAARCRPGWRTEPISTGTGMSRPRPLADSRPATASARRRPRRCRTRCPWATRSVAGRLRRRWPQRCPQPRARVGAVE